MNRERILNNENEFVRAMELAKSWDDLSGRDRVKHLFTVVESFVDRIKQEDIRPNEVERKIVDDLKLSPPNDTIKIKEWERYHDDQESGVTAEVEINGKTAVEIGKGAHAVIYEFGDKALRISEMPSYGLQQVIAWQLASEDAKKHLVKPEEYGRIEKDGKNFYYIVMEKVEPLRVTLPERGDRVKENEIYDFNKYQGDEEGDIVRDQQEQLILDVGESLGSFDMFGAENIGISEDEDGVKKLVIFDYGHWKSNDMRIWLTRNITNLSVPASWRLANEEIGNLVPQDMLTLFHKKAKKYIKLPPDSKYAVLFDVVLSGGVRWTSYGENIPTEDERTRFETWENQVQNVSNIKKAMEKYGEIMRQCHRDIEGVAGKYINNLMEKIYYHPSQDKIMKSLLEELEYQP